MGFSTSHSNLSPLTAEEVRGLPIQELIQRMDLIRESAHQERLGDLANHLPFPRVADIFAINSTSDLSEDRRRRLADAAFRFLFQLDLLMEAGGISNAVLFNEKFNNETSWQSPKFQMKYAVIGQYDIVASRIALECFFDLLHVAHKGSRIDSDKKFRAFRKWIVEPDNPYQYFLGHIVEAHLFDRKHRTPEVHGTSRFVHEIICLQAPSFETLNLPNLLTNILIDVWRPFLQILNGEKPLTIPIFSSCRDFASRYVLEHSDSEEFSIFLEELAERLK